MRKLVICLVALCLPQMVFAAATVSWLTPPAGSSLEVGTVVNPTGNANATGYIGGSGLDLALVIDVSGSMGWSPHWTLNNYAKPAAISLVNGLPQDTSSVAVIPFTGSASIRTPLTALNPDKQQVIDGINSLTASGGTNIGAGVAVGENAINAGHTPGRTKMMVVLSDGEDIYGNHGPGNAAAAYANSGIITHTVGVPGHNQSEMQSIATAGNGIYTNVSDLGQLESLFDGTGGNLVGLSYIDVQLPDGSWLYGYATDGLGNFSLPNWSMRYGANTFNVVAHATDTTWASASLTLYGVDSHNVIPAPGALLLGGIGTSIVGWMRRRRVI